MSPGVITSGWRKVDQSTICANIIVPDNLFIPSVKPYCLLLKNSLCRRLVHHMVSNYRLKHLEAHTS